MALSIVHGPPNSGRAGITRERFTAARGRDPVLVVPTFDDVVAFSRELCPDGGSLLGGSVTTFDGLFREVAEATESAAPPELTKAQRLRLFSAAVARARPRLLRASSARPGFAPALEELVSELQASEVSPGELAGSAQDLGASALLAEIAELYAAYIELRDEAGRGDAHLSAARAIAALRSDPTAWRGRPVIVYGFDDLTAQQLSLLQALAPITEVTAAVTFEDRESLAARSELIGRLRDTADRDPANDVEVAPDAANTESPLLYAIERGFLARGGEPATPDASLRMLRCAGEQAEAEAVGGEIARLLAEGADPGGVAVALRDPNSRGPLIGRVLASYGIPVAVEADLSITETATGSALAGLLRASQPGATAANLLTFLGAPGQGLGANVDRLERGLRREAVIEIEEAERRWTEAGGRGLEPLAALREAGTDRRAFLRIAAETALDISQWPVKLGNRRGELAAPDEAVELRAGAAIAAGLSEMAELDACLPEPGELAALIESMTLPLWTGPATGRVRIASPYRLRAARFETVFVVSLQDGEFPSHRSSGPFLSDEQRAAAGLKKRSDSEAEERYLFHVCLSLPTKRLLLSHRYCDDEGKTLAPSPYLDDVAAMLDAPPEQETRSLADVVFAPESAPSPAELARALAAQRRTEAPAGLALPGPLAEEIGAQLREAGAYDPEPGPIEHPLVLETLATVPAYGASTLEGYGTCSYRWFVDHELNPKPLDPDGEQLANGSAVHNALEALYAEALGDGKARPTLDTVDEWAARGSEILTEKLALHSPAGSAAARIGRRRLHGLMHDYLRRDARRDDSFATAMLEAKFGRGEEDKPPLQFGDWALHGSIDRIDLDPEGRRAVIHDYKVGASVPMQSNFERKRRLQMTLYMKAVEELWSAEAAAGVYHPLGKGLRARSRGLGRADEREELENLGMAKPDWVDEAVFGERMEGATKLAGEIVAGMRGGRITRDPLEDKCPPFCTFAPICRLDRRADTGGEQPVREGASE